MTIDKASTDPVQSSEEGARDVALVVDVGNLAHGLREAGDWEGIALVLAGLLHRIEALTPVSVRIAVCDPNLALTLGWPLHRMAFAIRVVTGSRLDVIHALEECLDTSPARECGTVVLGSGDVALVPAVERLRADGHRVCVAGRRGMIAPELLAAAEDRVEISVLEESY